MSITAPTYVTREEVKAALDVAETARVDARVDRACETATRVVDAHLQRRFVPWTGTRYKPWPARAYGTPWRLWLDADNLVSVATLTSGGTAIAAGDYFLEPANTGPPYTHIELDLAGAAAFGGGSTHQRDIGITGVWCGCPLDEATAGALAEALDASETGVDVTDSAAVGVGSLLRVDTERLLVVGKTMLTTGQTLQSAVTAAANAVTLAVTTGSAYSVGETVLLDSERMLIVDIAGNNLTVRRAHDGTVLAAHTGSTIYAPRTLTVVRAAQGTTAATHLTAAPLARHVVPPLVRDYALAVAVNQLLQESAGYARVAGSGDNAREYTGRGIKDVAGAACVAHGRNARLRAV